MNAGAKQRFARVDVADADDHAPVHQVLLDRDAPIAARAPQVVGVEVLAERLGPQILEQRMRGRRRGQHEAAESTRVVEAQRAAFGEVHVDVIVSAPARPARADSASCPTCRDARATCRRRCRTTDICARRSRLPMRAAGERARQLLRRANAGAAREPRRVRSCGRRRRAGGRGAWFRLRAAPASRELTPRARGAKILSLRDATHVGGSFVGVASVYRLYCKATQGRLILGAAGTYKDS